MQENIKIRWLTDNEHTKIAPKTLATQVYNEDGTLYKDTIENTLVNTTTKIDQVESDVAVLYEKLKSNKQLGFYCIEDVTIVLNGVSTIYPANSTVEISLTDNDVFEIIPTSDSSILTLTAFPGALATYYSWLEGVKQFSNILFDMNSEDMYTKWSQGNQGAYQVQFAQYTNCIFWSDNPYISDVAKRTNYTLCSTSQLPLCYSNIPDNTFKAFYLAFGVNNDPNWNNPVYKESFAKATWATQVFSYYGARVIGYPGHDSANFIITLPKDCRGLMFDARNIECAGTFDAANVTNFGAKSGSWREAFGDCPSLRRLYIKNLKVNLNISWSPIDYSSIYYIISTAANTNKITISVSPYTYNLLSQSDFDLAASKNITIALISTNYVEDKRLSDIANKADKSYVDEKITGLVNSAPETLDTIGELATAFQENDEVIKALNEAIIAKADKNYVDELIANIPTESNIVIVDCPNGTTISHTFEQIMAAVNDNQAVCASIYGSIIAPLTRIAEDESFVEFHSVGFETDEDQYTTAWIDGLRVNSDNTFNVKFVDLLANVLLKTEQTLTDEELTQVQNNLRYAGKNTAGLTVTPYAIAEVDYGTENYRIEETPLEPVIAGEGAEVFNLYDGMNVASGIYSSVFGHHNVASGDYSTAFGRWNMVKGHAAFASGMLNEASGHYSIAEGTHTKALNNNAHAEGESTQAIAARSHSEGYYTTASGNQAHAEGMYTVASGVNAHAEGEYSEATGRGAHAEGQRTKASGRNAFAGGKYTIAAGADQTVHGAYNISDTTSAMIIGNGTAEDARSNAYTIDKKGNAWFSGDIYTGSTSGINKDEGSKKLATVEYVDIRVPAWTAEDEGKVLQIVNGTPTWVLPATTISE